jgi:arylsulfatase A-like enzyme
MLCLVILLAGVAQAADKPNIIYILADDLGYGDVRCLNPLGKIPTPHIDQLAAEGMRFTDAHSSSAVCTPTRYGIMTGRYNWRSRLKSGVLGGFSPRLIEEGRLTVASMLRQQGYHTACVGKWHLGMDFPLKSGGFAQDYPDGVHVDFSRPIVNGPLAVGFDEYFGISASLDMPPYVFIRQDRTVEIPTRQAELWPKRIGPVGDSFRLDEVLATLTRQATEYIRRRGSEGRPFFLYLPLNSPHTPIVPTVEWKGRSGLNAYADFVMQTDATVGAVMQAVQAAGLAQQTMIVLTSDNGCSPQADFPALRERGHNPSHVFRGNKADIFEGGHRVPFIVRWPERVKADSTSAQIVCLTDLMATLADLLGVTLPADAGEDSVSLLPVLTGQAAATARTSIVHHSANGSFAIRQERWKLAVCPDSGGWSEPRPNSKKSASLAPMQLYDLDADPGETRNLASEQPGQVSRLLALLEQQVAQGRSTPGTPVANTTPVSIHPKR